MRSVKFLFVAAATALLSTAAVAADMPSIVPPPPGPYPQAYPQPYPQPYPQQYMRAADHRGFRRLVSARRRRHEQPEGRQPVQRALQLAGHHRDDGSIPASTAPASSGSASAIRSIAGSAATSRPNGAARRTSTGSISSTSTAHRSASTNISASKSRAPVPVQRVRRSRHLVVHHAVRRRRRRLAAQHRFQASARTAQYAVDQRRRHLRRGRQQDGRSPGRCTPVSPTRSPTTVTIEARLSLGHLGDAASRRLHHLQRHRQRQQPMDVSRHDVERFPPRRTLDLLRSAAAGTASAAAAGPQGLTSPLTGLTDGAGDSPRRLLFCGSRWCSNRRGQRLVKVNRQ